MSGLTQIAIFAENKPGRLEKITGIFAEAEINILAINIVGTGDFGVIRLMVDKYDEALRLLKESGFMVSPSEVLAIAMEDRPGGLHDIVKVLTRHSINLENAYVFIESSRTRSYLLVEVKDVKNAETLLQQEGISFYKKDTKDKNPQEGVL